MTINQKKTTIATAARTLATELQNGLKPNFGYAGVTLYRDGTPGDIVGHLLTRAGLAPRVHVDETDPKVVLALALGTTVYALPNDLQVALNELAIKSDDSKRSYARRVPLLVKLLTSFANVLDTASVSTATAVAVPPPQTGVSGQFWLPGKTI